MASEPANGSREAAAAAAAAAVAAAAEQAAVPRQLVGHSAFKVRCVRTCVSLSYFVTTQLQAHPSVPGLLAPPQRHNPRTDRFPMHAFHHVEMWCGDATNTSSRSVC